MRLCWFIVIYDSETTYKLLMSSVWLRYNFKYEDGLKLKGIQDLSKPIWISWYVPSQITSLYFFYLDLKHLKYSQVTLGSVWLGYKLG